MKIYLNFKDFTFLFWKFLIRKKNVNLMGLKIKFWMLIEIRESKFFFCIITGSMPFNKPHKSSNHHSMKNHRSQSNVQQGRPSQSNYQDMQEFQE